MSSCLTGAPALARTLSVYFHKRPTMCKGYYPYALIVYAILLLLSMGFVKKSLLFCIVFVYLWCKFSPVPFSQGIFQPYRCWWLHLCLSS